MNTRTVGLGALALVAGAAVGTTVLQARASGARTASATAPIASAVDRRVAAEGRVVAYPGAEVKVGAERAGRLLRVLVQEGQTVRAGDTLAEIESEEIRAALDEARARVTEAEAEVRLAEANLERRQKLVAE